MVIHASDLTDYEEVIGEARSDLEAEGRRGRGTLDSYGHYLDCNISRRYRSLWRPTFAFYTMPTRSIIWVDTCRTRCSMKFEEGGWRTGPEMECLLNDGARWELIGNWVLQ